MFVVDCRGAGGDGDLSFHVLCRSGLGVVTTDGLAWRIISRWRLETKVLEVVRGHEVPVHAAGQVRFGQLTALVHVDALDLLNTGQVSLHDIGTLAYIGHGWSQSAWTDAPCSVPREPLQSICISHTIVVQREAAPLWSLYGSESGIIAPER